jgi:hypothetical protein
MRASAPGERRWRGQARRRYASRKAAAIAAGDYTGAAGFRLPGRQPRRRARGAPPHLSLCQQSPALPLLWVTESASASLLDTTMRPSSASLSSRRRCGAWAHRRRVGSSDPGSLHAPRATAGARGEAEVRAGARSCPRPTGSRSGTALPTAALSRRRRRGAGGPGGAPRLLRPRGPLQRRRGLLEGSRRQCQRQRQRPRLAALCRAVQSHQRGGGGGATGPWARADLARSLHRGARPRPLHCTAQLAPRR